VPLPQELGRLAGQLAWAYWHAASVGSGPMRPDTAVGLTGTGNGLGPMTRGGNPDAGAPSVRVAGIWVLAERDGELAA
jgi:hypothetical protein